MPFARLSLSLDLSPDEGRRLCNDLTDLIADELGKRKELTSVLIDVPGGITGLLAVVVSGHRHILKSA
jgi:hypothetical protein